MRIDEREPCFRALEIALLRPCHIKFQSRWTVRRGGRIHGGLRTNELRGGGVGETAHRAAERVREHIAPFGTSNSETWMVVAAPRDSFSAVTTSQSVRAGCETGGSEWVNFGHSWQQQGANCVRRGLVE